MNKLFAVGLLALVPMSFGLTTWSGADADYRVETGTDDGSGESGYWLSYSDKDKNGGSSEVTWPVAPGNIYDAKALDPIIDECGGLCGTVSLGAGYEFPFAGVGFNLAGPKQTGVDITSWGGVCVVYAAEGIAPIVELVPENEKTYTEYNNYMKALSLSATSADLSWSDFKQDKSWGVTIDQAEYLTKVAAIKFKFSGKAGTTGKFNITMVGEKGKCSGGSAGILPGNPVYNEPLFEAGPVITDGKMIDNLNDGNKVAENIGSKAFWYAFASGAEIANESDDFGYHVVDAEKGYANLLGISGVGENSSWSTIGLGLTVTKALKNCSSITYDYMGSAHKLRATMEGITPNHGYEHATGIIEASETWKTVTIYPNNLSQAWWTESEDEASVMDFSWTAVDELVWIIDEKIEDGVKENLYVDNLRCNGELSEMENPASVLIDDFADGNQIAENIGKNAKWEAFTGGSGVLGNKVDENDEFIVVSPDDEYAYMVNFKIVRIDYDDFPSVELALHVYGALSECSAITYDYRGQAHRFRATLSTLEQGKGYDHEYNVGGSKFWNTVTVKAKDLKQGSWVASQSKENVQDFDWAKVYRLSWIVNNETYDKGLTSEFYIDNVRCVGELSEETISEEDVGHSSPSMPESSSGTASVEFMDKTLNSQDVVVGDAIKNVCFTYNGEISINKVALPDGIFLKYYDDERPKRVCLRGTVDDGTEAGTYEYTVTVGKTTLKGEINVVANGDSESSSSDEELSSSSVAKSSSSKGSSDDSDDEDSDDEDEKLDAIAKVGNNISVTLHGKVLSVAGVSNARVEIFDVQGHVVHVAQNVRGLVSLKTLKAGAYVVRVRSGSLNLVQRVVLK